jgi:hypothetical protein
MKPKRPIVIFIPNRVVKRVPMDFNWPLHQVWDGYLAAQPSEPPAGPGWQLWETTTEGSPISPVFESFAVLCEWASQHATTFGDHQATVAEWRALLAA